MPIEKLGSRRAFPEGSRKALADKKKNGSPENIRRNKSEPKQILNAKALLADK